MINICCCSLGLAEFLNHWRNFKSRFKEEDDSGMDVSQEVPIYFTLINQRMDQISYFNKTDYYYDYKFYINRLNLPNFLCYEL